jgi:hypothetical protein
MHVAAGQDEGDRTALAFDESMDLGRAAVPFGRIDASLAAILCTSARMPSDAGALRSLAAVTAFK